jgi:hypothetical protein
MIMHILHMYNSKHPHTWDESLPYVQHSYNRALHSSTDHNPFQCWLWSLIIFLIQRSLLSAMFIPHEVFTPKKYVHSSTQGSAEGGYPLCGVWGGYPLGWGVWGQAGPQWGFGGEAPEAKFAL